MTIADKLTLLANTKEALRAKLKLAKSVPFSKYPDYVNWQNVPSIPNKAFYADFTNDRYVKDGVPCNFKDLFTFTRAGKAWLVKDTGLQEYAVDVPRLDSGLLIEGELTNQFKNNEVINNYGGDKVSKNVIDDSFFGKAVTYTNIDTSAEYNSNIIDMPVYPFTEYQAEGGALRQVYVKKDSAKYFQFSLKSGSSSAGIFDISKGTLIGQSGEYTSNTTITSIGDYWLITWVDYGPGYSRSQFNMSFSSSDDISRLGIANQALKSVEGDKLTIAIPFYANPVGDVTSSTPIITDATPVTRPADYLLNNITGTTVTGDWDSTLTLSIMAGKLVHSGYGRIRSLEIN